MKLYITQPSPFARKCRIVAREKGLLARIEEIAVDPYNNAPELVAANPIVQVPTLIAADGLPLNGSALICEYLDTVGEGPRLLPADGLDRLRVRRIETLADSAMEMGVKLVLEKRRPEHERSPSWIARWTDNMARTLDRLEGEPLLSRPVDLGVIATGVAVTWIGFRHPDFDLASGRPKLISLQQNAEARASFGETYPR